MSFESFEQNITPLRGSSSDHKTLSSTDLDALYESQPVFEEYQQYQAERTPSPYSKTVREYAENIARAREMRMNRQFFIKVHKPRNPISNVVYRLFNDEPSTQIEPLTTEILLKHESQIGASIFPPARPDVRNEFFNFDRDHWFFHQSLVDSSGNVIDEVTMHYDIQSDGILKVCSNADVSNVIISGQELVHFMDATKIYHDRVLGELYQDDHQLAA
ncbi:hypothetical protein HGB25_03380 [Candidatus Saccharibacteria bacterium]|nr:hypothetical protein [Candidatus Saccharibacteria bacterium]